jgi:hypothetical protein
MTESDDGEKPVFHVGQVYPRISDYDRAWSLDGVAVIKLIEESCFWGFLGWFGEIRPEATPDSEPLFSAEIRWQGFEMGPFEGEATLLSGPGDSRSSSGPML